MALAFLLASAKANSLNQNLADFGNPRSDSTQAQRALGQQFYVSSVEDLSGETDQFAKSQTARIDTLRSAQSHYLLFEQMGVLVYALNASGLAAAGSSQHDTLSSLYQLALLDRSTSMRQMIGELARAKQLTYRETSDKYGALIAAARKDVSLASYQAVDDFETQTMRQADALMARLQDALLSAERTKGDLDALAARRKLQLIMVMTLGSTLLLAANLMSEKPRLKQKRPRPPTRSPPQSGSSNSPSGNRRRWAAGRAKRRRPPTRRLKASKVNPPPA